VQRKGEGDGAVGEENTNTGGGGKPRNMRGGVGATELERAPREKPRFRDGTQGQKKAKKNTSDLKTRGETKRVIDQQLGAAYSYHILRRGTKEGGKKELSKDVTKKCFFIKSEVV